MGSSRVQVICPTCKTVFLPTIKEVQSRAGASARRKGHAFERKVAKQLQDWWNTNREQKCEFRRSPQSGGSALKVGFRMFGDVVSNASDFIFGIECKNAPGSYAGLHQFLSAEKFVFWNWLEQATGDCPKDAVSWIIFTRYDQPTLCASIHGSFSCGIMYTLDTANLDYFIFHSNKRNVSIIIWKFDDMIKTSPDVWKWPENRKHC